MKGKTSKRMISTNSVANCCNPKLISLALIITFSVITTSCGTNSVFEENAAVDVKEWHMNDVKAFKATFQDSLQPLDFYVEIRNSTSYPNNKLFLFFNTTFPDGRSARDTLACVLASPDGRWLGNGLGSVKDNLFLVKRKVLLPRKGTYTFTLQHAMRDSIVKGIHDVGIKIKSSEISHN